MTDRQRLLWQFGCAPYTAGQTKPQQTHTHTQTVLTPTLPPVPCMVLPRTWGLGGWLDSSKDSHNGKIGIINSKSIMFFFCTRIPQADTSVKCNGMLCRRIIIAWGP